MIIDTLRTPDTTKLQNVEAVIVTEEVRNLLITKKALIDAIFSHKDAEKDKPPEGSASLRIVVKGSNQDIHGLFLYCNCNGLLSIHDTPVDPKSQDFLKYSEAIDKGKRGEDESDEETFNIATLPSPRLTIAPDAADTLKVEFETPYEGDNGNPPKHELIAIKKGNNWVMMKSESTATVIKPEIRRRGTDHLALSPKSLSVQWTPQSQDLQKIQKIIEETREFISSQ